MTSVENINRDIETQLRNSLSLIATDVDDKYGKLKVSANLPSAASLLFDRLQNSEENAAAAVFQIQQAVDESDKENSHETLIEIKTRAEVCQKILELIQSMKRIEEQLTILRSKNNTAIAWGQAVNDCKDYIKDVTMLANESKNDGLNVEESLKHFSAEYSQLCYQCRYSFSAEYERYMKLPKISKQKHDRESISISLKKIVEHIEFEALNQTLTAMNMIGQLPERLEIWKTIILDVFCEEIINCRDGGKAYTLRTTNNISKFVLSGRAKGRHEFPINVDHVLSAFEIFFGELHELIGNLRLQDATGKSFVSIIGTYIEQPLISMVLEKVIAIAAPVCTSGDEDQEMFKSYITRGEQFVTKMKEFGFFSQATKLLFKYDVERIFVDRRCFAIVSKATELISANYTETSIVGCSGEEKDVDNSLRVINAKLTSMFESGKEFEEIKKLMLRRTGDSCFSPLFALQKCTVSVSAVAFVELLRETMKAVFETKDEHAQGKLLVTAQNIVRLYVLLSPRRHAEVFSSVPTMAAIFYNNCYYIAHCIMTMSLEVAKKDDKTMLESLLTDSIIRLRDAAADSLEDMLTRVKRDLALYLGDHSAFEHLPPNYKTTADLFTSKPMSVKDQPKLVQSLSASFLLITSIAKNLREVVTEIVYCKSIGSLVSFTFESLINHILSTTDIRENDANAMADIFKKVMLTADELLVYREKGRIGEFCAREYFRLHEVVFALGNRMQDIQMRWFRGNGPMAEFLSRDEVVQLIKALFAESEHRKECIANL